MLAACGGDDGPAPPIDAPPSCTANGAITSIVGNHGHSMIVTAAEIGSPTDRQYDITGGADHSHVVNLDAAAFERLATNMSVTATSTVGGGHTHAITVRCR